MRLLECFFRLECHSMHAYYIECLLSTKSKQTLGAANKTSHTLSNAGGPPFA